MAIQSIDTKFATDPVVTPAATDRIMVTQGGTTRVETRGQFHVLESGESLTGEDAAAPAIVDEAASSTNPTLIPNKADLDTGVGSAAANQLSLIAGAIEAARLNNVAVGVNYLDITPSIATNPVLLGVDGTDTNIDLQLTPKGTGNVTLVSGNHLVLPVVNEPATPTLEFGAGGGLGIFATSATNLGFAMSGVTYWTMDASYFLAANTGGGGFKRSGASATVPSVFPNRSDLNTGLGSDTGTADNLSFIAGGVSCMEIAEVGAAAKIGFFGTAAVVKPTGVTVDAASIHAALVTLGLIAA